MFSIEIQDTATGKKVGTVDDDGISFSLSPSGDRLLSIRFADTIALFDTERGSRLLEAGSDVDGVSTAHTIVLIDDHRVISTSPTGTIWLLDLSKPAKYVVVGDVHVAAAVGGQPCLRYTGCRLVFLNEEGVSECARSRSCWQLR